MNISMVGCGHLGCVVAASFASAGHQLQCFDIRRKNFDDLPYEPGLRQLIQQNIQRITFAERLGDLLAHSKLLYFCLSAPSGEQGLIDTSNLLASVAQIKNTQGLCLFIKTTVPVGTCRQVQQCLRTNGNLNYQVIFEPEFTSESTAVKDFTQASYRVFGCDEQQAALPIIEKVYRPLDKQAAVAYHCMDIESAELSKLALNSMLACRLSFVNELANYASTCGANVDQLMKVIGSDRRLGKHYLRPGIGYGGMCLPKDIHSLCHQMQASSGTAMLPAIMASNRTQHQVIFAMAKRRFPDLSQCRVAFLGYSFKGGTSDTRASPALDVLRLFIAAQAQLSVYDPQAPLPDDYASSCVVAATPLEAVAAADCIVLGSDWSSLMNMEWPTIAADMRHAILFDCKNCLDPILLQQAGFEYYAVGHAWPPLQ